MTPNGEGGPFAVRSISSPATILPRGLPPLEFRLTTNAAIDRLSGLQKEHILAVTSFGEPAAVRRASVASSFLALPSLDGDPVELWLSARSVSRSHEAGIDLADDGSLLFGQMNVVGCGAEQLEAQSREAYQRLLAVCAARDRDHLLRVWNVVPRINAEEAGLERYKAFCKGRAEGYAAHYGESGMNAHLPASSAVGSEGDVLTIHFLAARSHGCHAENPRQISAYHYPPQYGPRSPSFARATVAPAEAGSLLFVSGTASIVGHESCHHGNLHAQLDETLRNITALVGTIDGQPIEESRWVERLLALRIYVRHPADWPEVKAALLNRCGAQLPHVAVKADICRRELLLEIEAVLRPGKHR